MRWTRSVSLFLVLALGCFAARAEAPVSAEFESDILRLMELTGAKLLGQQMGAAVSQQIVDAIRESQPDFPDRAAVIVQEVVVEQLKDDALWDRLVPIYAKHFTHEEIRQMIAFYQTPLGKKTIEVMPQLMADSVKAGQEWAVAGQDKMEARLKQRLAAEGFLK